MRRGAWTGGLVVGVVAVVAIGLADGEAAPVWDGAVVPALAQTPAAYGDRDVADDAAIWVHPDDPTLSLVIGSNKGVPGGLQVFDLDGRQRQFLEASGPLNNVDLREGFPFPDGPGTLVGATNRTDGTVEFYRIDAERRGLVRLGSVRTGLPAVYGFCLYHSERSDSFYAVVTSEDGPVAQYQVDTTARGIDLRQVRRWELSSEGEGCVADDVHGQLYLTQEAKGLWKLPAEPAEPPTLMLVAGTGERPPLVADVEGVTLYDGGGEEGYLLVSSQGSSTFALYDRAAPHQYVGSFAVGEGPTADAVSSTDGVAVTSAPLGDRLPAGLLVVHDEDNLGADASNFKYVSWADVVAELGLDEDAVLR
jgi:3-phytase